MDSERLEVVIIGLLYNGLAWRLLGPGSEISLRFFQVKCCG